MAQTVKVVARFRPPNSLELREGGEIVVTFSGSDGVKLRSQEAIKGAEGGGFTFDKVFDMQATQAQVFNYGVREIVDDVLQGYNGTIFAYGQTGSGKSHTMSGPSIDDPTLKGIIPRITEQIFESIIASSTDAEYLVKCAYMELYQERIRDLLVPQNDNLQIHEDKARGVYVKGLSDYYVSSAAEVFEIMRQGGLARAVAATNMNEQSSRSHSIFVITVTQRNVETGSQKTGNLYLVDLAGSEKVGKTGASGQTLEEAKKINKSLSALGMVINALTDGKSQHIPYRDSKLTRILQESLGGNSRTTLIINCSPTAYNEAETLSTLRFGMRAKSIKNKARVNAELSAAELKLLLKKAQKDVELGQAYIAALERELAVWRGGGRVEASEYARSDAPATVASRVSSPQTPSRPFTPLSHVRTDTPATSDERDDFLRRENELADQLAERDAAAKAAEVLAVQLRSELDAFQRDSKTTTAELSDLRIQLERLTFENKEAAINADAFREQNSELSAELEELRRQIELRATQTTDDKDRKRAEKMAALMGTFETDKEAEIRAALGQTEDVNVLRQIASDQQDRLRAQSEESAALTRRRDELEARLATIEAEYEDLLAQTSDGAELKTRLEQQYAARRDAMTAEITDLRSHLDRKTSEAKDQAAQLEVANNHREELKRALATTVATVQGGNDLAESAKDLERIRRTMTAQLSDFDTMKKALMKDLQDRCEKVVELEISLDETREQYNNILRNSNSRAQQRKMEFLTRNLDQLAQVQKSLVEQNASLKKDVALAERKLIARNERIQQLEVLWTEANDRLAAQKEVFNRQIAETQTAAVTTQFSSFGRVAKPIRGGAGAAAAVSPGGGKRSSSWFFNAG